MALKRRCGNLYLLLVVLVPRENQHAAQGFDHHVYIRRYCPRAARLKVSICDRLIGAAAVVADATANGASRAIAAAAVLLNYVSSGCAAQAGGGIFRRFRSQIIYIHMLFEGPFTRLAGHPRRGRTSRFVQSMSASLWLVKTRRRAPFRHSRDMRGSMATYDVDHAQTKHTHHPYFDDK